MKYEYIVESFLDQSGGEDDGILLKILVNDYERVRFRFLGKCFKKEGNGWSEYQRALGQCLKFKIGGNVLISVQMYTVLS